MNTNELIEKILELEKRIEALEGKKQKRTFEKPSMYDLQVYFLERGSMTCNDDAERFFDFYESKNWFVGKTKMKDWKAAVRNWIRGNHARQSSNRETLTVLNDTDY